ncbi:MAG: phage/plasmid primase, P4 family [Alphaproteobacteria bacterium]
MPLDPNIAWDEADAIPPQYSDDALAVMFTERSVDLLRYLPAWGKWLAWDGARWIVDERCRNFALAREICRQQAADIRANSPNDALGKLARMIASARTINAVQSLAQSDPRQTLVPDDLDRDQWLLNTRAGTVDLRSGELHAHDRGDLITKLTGAALGAEYRGSMWLRFLDRIMDGNRELVDYMQRVAGYLLTGSTAEHALFYCYGTGSNGKSVFINTITRTLGDYATTAPAETFMQSKNDRHPTEIAALAGARVVTAQEVASGRVWDEGKIKALTGGDRIAARFMRGDFFQFTPQFKLLLAANHRPVLQTVDEAIKRRIHLIPFDITIKAEERDASLPDKLIAEAPAILRWMVDGCLEWQAQGLNPPDIIRETTERYLDGEDTLGQWLEECCERQAGTFTRTADLYSNYRRFCTERGEQPKSCKGFSEDLEKKSPTKRRNTAGQQGFGGLRPIECFGAGAGD